MAGTDRTVFISYRRSVSGYVARSIFADLRAHGYDVFIDVESIGSGLFETIILNQIAARAHFVVILTPGSLQRCTELGDWLRREIEYAMDLQRNIVPVLANDFSFGEEDPYLTGKLSQLKEYNSLAVPYDYFEEAMDRLRNRFLKQPVYAPITPTPATERAVVQRKIKRAAGRRAIAEGGEEIVERLVDLRMRAFVNKEEAAEMEKGLERLQEQIGRLEDGIPIMSDEEWKQVLQEAIKSAESLMGAKAVARKGEEKIAQALRIWSGSARTAVEGKPAPTREQWDPVRQAIVEQGEDAIGPLVALRMRALVKEEAAEMEKGLEGLQEQIGRLEDGISTMSDEEWKQVLQEAIRSGESLMEAEAVARKGEEKIARALGSWISLAQTTVKEGSARLFISNSPARPAS